MDYLYVLRKVSTKPDQAQSGLDLADAKDWSDPQLLERLLDRDEFRGAAYEVEVHAGLARGHFRVQRIPASKSEKCSDLRVWLGEEAHEVEVKLADPSELDSIEDELGEAISHRDLFVDGYEVHVRGSDALGARALDHTQRKLLRTEFEAISAAFESAVDAIRRAGARPGVFQVGQVGEVELRPTPGSTSVHPEVFPELFGRTKVARIARLVRDSVRKFRPGTRNGLVVFGVNHQADLGQVEDRVRSDASDDPELYSRCRLVVLKDWVTTSDRLGERTRNIAYPVPLPSTAILTPELTHFAAHAAGYLATPALVAQRAKPGQMAVHLKTDRRRRAVQHLATIAPPGPGTVSIRFDGSPPTFTPRINAEDDGSRGS